MKKHKLLLSLALIVILVVAAMLLLAQPAEAPTASTNTPKPAPTAAKPATSFNKSEFSRTDPASIWVIVNKQHQLVPKDYVPADLVVPTIPLRVPGNESMQVRQATATALEAMFAAAKEQGLNLMLSSGYRSYTYQVNLYNGYVASQGQATADTQSARPGYSEHQTGLGADIEPASKTCELEQCFSATPEGTWLAANAYKFGFIIRYTINDQAITGYEYEPWHVRYVGTDLSTELHNTHVDTLEQFFDVTGGKDY
ncbi:MAG: family metallopeptidase [Candidatus Saccharibacteria bacterium]|nr:family metallopeptidase [Candidatus Saccharibacteria bacterium]